MYRSMLKSKIHRARVTEANLDYEGSLTLDRSLMEKADIRPFEQVRIYNISTGDRFETYVMEGKPGSRIVCLNGAAARKGAVGDLIIIATYGIYSSEEMASGSSRIILLGPDNRILNQEDVPWTA